MRTTIIKVAAIFFLLATAKVFSADLSVHEQTCAELGFKKRTPAYGECVLELDRRSTDQQKQADRVRVDQQRQAQEQQQRTSQAAMQGDGTSDHQACYRYGFIPGTNPYAECRMKIDIARTEAAQKQAAYEADNLRYRGQVSAMEAEKEKQKNLKLLEFSARLMGTTSSNFGQSVGNAATGTMGMAPISMPAPPAIQNFTIRGPSGGMMYCTYTNNFMNCR